MELTMSRFEWSHPRRSILAAAAALVTIPKQTSAAAQQVQGTGARKVLIHIHTGPEDPTTAALGFLVALTAARQGHSVDVFLAGDGADLITDRALSTVEGRGTGNVGAHFRELASAGVRFHVSGMSARARGIEEAALAGKPAVFATPDTLVRLATSADVVLTY
jgi:uncharacterized protein